MIPQEHNERLKIRLQEYVDDCIKAAYKTDSMGEFRRLLQSASCFMDQLQKIENFNKD